MDFWMEIRNDVCICLCLIAFLFAQKKLSIVEYIINYLKADS